MEVGLLHERGKMAHRLIPSALMLSAVKVLVLYCKIDVKYNVITSTSTVLGTTVKLRNFCCGMPYRRCLKIHYCPEHVSTTIYLDWALVRTECSIRIVYSFRDNECRLCRVKYLGP